MGARGGSLDMRAESLQRLLHPFGCSPRRSLLEKAVMISHPIRLTGLRAR